jgi:hypothetical protein
VNKNFILSCLQIRKKVYICAYLKCQWPTIMKINDFILRYSFSINQIKDGICRIRTFINSKSQIILLITDLGKKNTSASVTNSIEVIYDTLISKYGTPKESVFIEHYEPSSIHNHTFDIVKIHSNKKTEWQSISLKDTVNLLECDETELNNSTFKNEVLLIEIEKIRTIIAPHSELPAQIGSEYILKQFEIQNRMLSKKSLLELIKQNSIETEFLKFLKNDLSFFAEIYASPSDSYVCLSEFPLNNGFVDFVLLTGVSMMDVFLIEIKGADFNLLTQNSYKKLNYRLDIAIGQIRDRLGYIHGNISEFKEFMHNIREKAISGEKKYNVLVGPKITTLVDRNKDINIHNIVIGGRTVNDLEESHKRHDFETTFQLPIKIESWDTFARKLRRN